MPDGESSGYGADENWLAAANITEDRATHSELLLGIVEMRIDAQPASKHQEVVGPGRRAQYPAQRLYRT